MDSSAAPLVRRVISLFLSGSMGLFAGITEEELGAFSRPALDEMENLATRDSKDVLSKISRTASFPKWKTFEDDRVKFSYPDHKAISLEIKEHDPIPVDPDRVSSVDTSFSRGYRLVAAGETINALMLTEADWLDDGICLCGAIAYERYLVRSGHFYRFSFLEDGVLKKMQVLGDRERLMMFEWTHLPIHPEVFRKMARSVELKKPGKWTDTVCRERVSRMYGAKDLVGWIDEGATAKSAEDLLGAPSRTGADGIRFWDYPKKEYGYEWTETISLPFKGDKLVRFDSDFHDSAWDKKKAIKGGAPWMIEMAEPYEEPPTRGSVAKIMPEPLKAELLESFLKNAANPEEDFNSLCQALKVLVEQGVRDKRALDIVRSRFSSEGGHYAAWVLHEAGLPEDTALFIRKVRGVYQRGHEKKDGRLDVEDMHNWLSFIPDEDERYPQLLREGLIHPHPSVRESAYFFLDSSPFPQEERIKFVRQGLADDSKRVRYWAVGYYEDHPMSAEDWDALDAAAKKETDGQNIKKMNQVLEKRPGH